MHWCTERSASEMLYTTRTQTCQHVVPSPTHIGITLARFFSCLMSLGASHHTLWYVACRLQCNVQPKKVRSGNPALPQLDPFSQSRPQALAVGWVCRCLPPYKPTPDRPQAQLHIINERTLKVLSSLSYVYKQPTHVAHDHAPHPLRSCEGASKRRGTKFGLSV